MTFIPRPTGYHLAMNRDERRTRPQGLPPTQTIVDGHHVVSPSDPRGGTWIALNDQGACLALVNWHSIPAKVNNSAVSRGQVVSSASSASTSDEVNAALSRLPLQNMNPFRLIGVFPSLGQIHEWQWDLQSLVQKAHLWQPQQWISSGFDERTAQVVRNQTFQDAQRQDPSGTLEWLRQLHRSHHPVTGPFSTCMHRADAATVSYTEISVTNSEASMEYTPGPPCETATLPVTRIEITPRAKTAA